jgi:hypothetical protein
MPQNSPVNRPLWAGCQEMVTAAILLRSTNGIFDNVTPRTTSRGSGHLPWGAFGLIAPVLPLSVITPQVGVSLAGDHAMISQS